MWHSSYSSEEDDEEEEQNDKTSVTEEDPHKLSERTAAEDAAHSELDSNVIHPDTSDEISEVSSKLAVSEIASNDKGEKTWHNKKSSIFHVFLLCVVISWLIGN